MKALDEYFKLQREIFNYFGYVEDWKVIPLDDQREMFWLLRGEGPGTVLRACKKEDLQEGGNGNFYEDTIYTQRFLPKWVYRGEKYTMICCDPHCDGNHFLRVFTNALEVVEAL